MAQMWNADMKIQSPAVAGIPLQGLAERQQVVVCPNCGHTALTETSYESSSQTKYD